jgi:F0F1-type ATP synthase membrane subunit a
MNRSLNNLVWMVAIGQFIPVLLYPPASLASASPVILGLAILVFAVVGFYLIRQRRWAKTLTIFMQGFNIIIRLMVLLSHGANSLKHGGGANWDVIIVSIISIGLSTLILYRFDVPEVELAFQR